ncbi:hypothetical protein H5410_014834 [Solanum commersonii]|uniref:Uncharacterized protein n=1 Tax=Solanum commersonii TaxID=4109 RepID=A0A9J5ZSJ9_SOLCO|nr:hypothetical protein H5410_014834 [Solanum commersonii]
MMIYKYIESLPRCLLIDIIERIAFGSFKDLMNVKLRWLVKHRLFEKSTSFLDFCKTSWNLEALYIKVETEASLVHPMHLR